MRVFVALDIPDAVRLAISGSVAKLRPFAPSARWVRIEGAHVTLKFIGEIPAEKVEPIQSALQSISLSRPIEMHFRGLGFFPNDKRPRVLWAGIDAPGLTELASKVESALEPLGVEREQRPFAPHLTLARMQSGPAPNALLGAMDREARSEFGFGIVTEFYLYQSILKRGGAEYTRLSAFPFVRSE